MGKNRIFAKNHFQKTQILSAKVDYSENNRYFCAYYKEKKLKTTQIIKNYGRINK